VLVPDGLAVSGALEGLLEIGIGLADVMSQGGQAQMCSKALGVVHTLKTKKAKERRQPAGAVAEDRTRRIFGVLDVLREC
jgi:hypothetical protein